jgi:hypothetical protein
MDSPIVIVRTVYTPHWRYLVARIADRLGVRSVTEWAARGVVVDLYVGRHPHMHCDLSALLRGGVWR